MLENKQPTNLVISNTKVIIYYLSNHSLAPIVTAGAWKQQLFMHKLQPNKKKERGRRKPERKLICANKQFELMWQHLNEDSKKEKLKLQERKKRNAKKWNTKKKNDINDKGKEKELEMHQIIFLHSISCFKSAEAMRWSSLASTL